MVRLVLKGKDTISSSRNLLLYNFVTHALLVMADHREISVKIALYFLQ
jgi:hypothetical protein